MPIKVGQLFGGAGGADFDDSRSSEFQMGAYVDKIHVYHDNHGLEAYKFSYYVPTRDDTIEAALHGTQTFLTRRIFEYEKHGIDKVEGRIVNKTLYWQNGTAYTKSIITSIRFKSFQHVSNPVDNETVGIGFSESFKNYKLGYVRGKSSEYIEQIQFVWYWHPT